MEGLYKKTKGYHKENFQTSIFERVFFLYVANHDYVDLPAKFQTSVLFSILFVICSGGCRFTTRWEYSGQWPRDGLESTHLRHR